MSASPLRGGCACGAVRFEADPPSRFVAHCHCANCRRAHGAAFVTWAGFTEAQVRVVDGASELSGWITPTGATRRFCTRCGTPLFFSSPRWDGEVHVAVAGFDEGPDVLPRAHAYADRATGWCPLPEDGLPRYGGEDGAQPI